MGSELNYAISHRHIHVIPLALYTVQICISEVCIKVRSLIEQQLTIQSSYKLCHLYNTMYFPSQLGVLFQDGKDGKNL